MWQRIIFTILLIIVVVFLPFWFYFLLTLFGIFYFKFYLEAFFVLLFSDLLYGVNIDKTFNIVFSQSLLVFIVLLIAEFIKKNSKFYKKEND